MAHHVHYALCMERYARHVVLGVLCTARYAWHATYVPQLPSGVNIRLTP